MKTPDPILLIIAAGYCEAFDLARANGLLPVPAHVRTIVRPQALRGWSFGTPALIGRLCDFPDALAKAVELARQQGRIRLAEADDLAVAA